MEESTGKRFKFSSGHTLVRTGCVIMASGIGKRFGGNKLMEEFRGKPMIRWILDCTEGIFDQRVVVTRHESVARLCRDLEIEVILHELPGRNDTVRLGLEIMKDEVDYCMFCPGDQPMLKQETVEALMEKVLYEHGKEHERRCIWRTAWMENAGMPVVFPKWVFEELMNLPQGKGGGVLIRKYPEYVKEIQVSLQQELIDIDTRETLERWNRGNNP